MYQHGEYIFIISVYFHIFSIVSKFQLNSKLFTLKKFVEELVKFLYLWFLKIIKEGEIMLHEP